MTSIARDWQQNDDLGPLTIFKPYRVEVAKGRLHSCHVGPLTPVRGWLRTVLQSGMGIRIYEHRRSAVKFGRVTVGCISLAIVVGVGTLMPIARVASAVGATSVTLPSYLKATQPVQASRAGSSSAIYVLWQRSGTCTNCWVLTRTTYDFRPLVRVTTPPDSPNANGSPTGTLAFLVFADARDGMALYQSSAGRDSLFVTHDGAATWVPWPMSKGAQIMDLTTSPTGFFATERVCATSSFKCVDTFLLRASPHATRWTITPIPGAQKLQGEMISVAAWRHHVWLAGNTTTKTYAFLATSSDGGRTFSTRGAQALISLSSCGLTASSETALWAGCRGGMAIDLMHSADAGGTWTQIPTPAPFMGTGGGILTPLSGSTAYLDMGLGKFPFYFVGGSGRALTARGKAPLQLFTSLVFVSPRQGLALGQTTEGSSFSAAFTSDGGRHWTHVHP